MSNETPRSNAGERGSIAVAGAGLAGSLVATMLARRGHHVRIYEKRADLRASDGSAGRSINLALSTRGIRALERIGRADAVLSDAIPMRGRQLHTVDGKEAFQPYGLPGQSIFSVSRRKLNEQLLDAAEEAGVEIAFEKPIVDVDLDEPAVFVSTGSDEESTRVEADLVIGADGAFSAVRGRMQRTERFDYAQTYLGHGYKELTIPPADGGGFRLEPNALHIWPRHDYMLIALPNADRTFTCTLFLPFEGDPSFAALDDEDSLQSFFSESFPSAVPHLPNLVEEFFSNPTGSMVYVQCSPYHHEGRVLLVGDAAHAVVPFYGQGMNAAFEDCYVLDELLSTHGARWLEVAQTYHALRKPNADAICELALRNFVEMRSDVASPLFRLRKALERGVHRRFPELYAPVYSLVTFSNEPYDKALRRADREAAVWAALDKLLPVAAGAGAVTALRRALSSSDEES